MADFDRTIGKARTPGPAPEARAAAPTAEAILEASRRRVVDQIMREVREVSLDSLSREEALALASSISTKLRALGRARLSPEDNRVLGDLMARLLTAR